MRRRRFLAALAGTATLSGLPLARGTALASLPSASPDRGFVGPIVGRQVDHVRPALLGMVRRASGARTLALGPDARPMGTFAALAPDARPAGAAVAAIGPGVGLEGPVWLTSPVVDAKQLFDRVGVHATAANGLAEAMTVELRASPDGAAWAGWRALRVDRHLTDRGSPTRYFPPRAFPPDSRYAQYRLKLTSGDPSGIELVALTFIDVSDLNRGPLARLMDGVRGAVAGAARALGETSVAMAAPTQAPKILTRQDWGANESLMTWSPQYVPVQKIVLHHTDTDDGGTNVAATIRSIYYFHAVTKGWGDIGYNYLVDKYGNIWIGRQGGDGVVGGHAYGWNEGTIGVAAVGTYVTVAPTGALQGAIANILALKMKQLGVAPYGSGAFTHQEQAADGSWVHVTTSVPNVLGHRDCNDVVGQHGGQTDCPGDALYPMLAGLRGLAQNAWQNGYTTLARLDPQLQNGGFPGQSLQPTVGVTNLGATTIPAGTMVNYRLLSNGGVVAQGPGAALSQPLPPGGIGVVTLPFIAPPAGGYLVRWDLMTAGVWWNTLYQQPVRDAWFRSSDWSASWIQDDVPNKWTAGETRLITVEVLNDGGRVWNAGGTDPVQLGYYWTSTYTGNRIAGVNFQPLAADVLPGQTVTLQIPLVAPPYPTSYTMALDLHKTNEFWFGDKRITPDDTPTTVVVDFHAAYQIGPLPPFTAGQTATVPITVMNTGKGTFPTTNAQPVDLGYHWYDASGKAVVWDGARTRIGTDLPAGASVAVQAQVTAPPAGGALSLRFDLVQEGVGWFSMNGVPTGNVAVTVKTPPVPVYGATYMPDVSTFAQSGALAAVPITVTNTSNFAWPAGGPTPVHLGYHWLSAAGAMVLWDGLRTSLSADVAPGASVTLQANVAVPAGQGSYTLRWDLVQEGVTWFSEKGVPTFDQSVVVGAPPVYGGSIDVSKAPSAMPARMTTSVPLKVQNMSNFAWGTNVDLSYHWYDASGNVVVWDGARTPLAGIAPGEVRALSAAVVGPQSAGTYTLKFDIVQEGVTWFSSQGMQLAPIAVAVQVAALGALYSAPASVAGSAGATISVPIMLTNVGTTAWQPGALNLAYHLYAADGNTYVWDGARTALPQAIAPGQSVTLSAAVRVPPAAGSYTIRWDLVQEGVAWSSQLGVPSGSSALLAQ